MWPMSAALQATNVLAKASDSTSRFTAGSKTYTGPLFALYVQNARLWRYMEGAYEGSRYRSGSSSNSSLQPLPQK
jgi:hypothetical protein